MKNKEKIKYLRNEIYKKNYTNNLIYHLNKKYENDKKILNKINKDNEFLKYIDITLKEIIKKYNYDNDYIIKNYFQILKDL